MAEQQTEPDREQTCCVDGAPARITAGSPGLPRRLLCALPGEVLAIVGESGSGKNDALNVVGAAGRAPAKCTYRMRDGVLRDLACPREPSGGSVPNRLGAMCIQDPAQGLRMAVSAGAMVGSG